MASPLVQFSAEFVTFLVASAGLSLALLRGSLLARAGTPRTAAAIGFIALGASAFLHGSQLQPDLAHPTVIVPRVLAVVALLVTSLRWAGGARSRGASALGALCFAASLITGLRGATYAEAALLITGALITGGALLGAARRSISARVAVTSGATLLLVVLLLSVALSSVLSSSLEAEARQRLASRANTEAGLVEETQRDALRSGATVMAIIAARKPVLVQSVANTLGRNPEMQSVLSGLREDDFFRDTSLAYLSRGGHYIATTGLDDAAWAQLSGSDVLTQSVASSSARTSVATVAGQRGIAVAAVPVQLQPGGEIFGTILTTIEVGSPYLEERLLGEDDLSFSLGTPITPTASAGRQPSEKVRRETVRNAVVDDRAVATEEDGRFVAAAPVHAGDRPILAFVVSTPSTVVDDTRGDLFRTLFLIAMGGTIAALLLASFVGERIGSGLRRLTNAAEEIQAGNLAVRADIRTSDEIGALGAAFDSMASAVQRSTTALQDAADAEARLRNRLETVIGGMGEALVAVDAEGVVTDINPAAEDLLGRPATAVRGRPVAAVLAGSLDDGRDIADAVSSAPVDPWFATGTVVCADEERVPVGLSAGPLRGPAGDAAGQVVVLRDLRREHEVERMKAEFLSRVQHEMRTPLTAIKGYAHLLAHKTVPKVQAKTFQREILSNADKLIRIVRMIEFVAAAEGGRTVLHPGPVTVKELLDTTVKRWEGRLNGQHSLRGHGRRGLPPVAADVEWLGSCLDELVDNAVKFSPDGGSITVAARVVDDWVEISVADHGVGMSDHERDAVFTDFYQGDSSDTRRFGGLGLGLTMVQRVVEAHGGWVECESSPGKGSKFSILLPVLPTDEGDEASVDGRRRAGRRPRGSVR